MSREVHVRFWERAGVRFPRATRLPLHRQSDIYARGGVEIDRSVMAGWVGHMAALMEPLTERIARHVRAGAACTLTIRRFRCSTPVAAGRRRADYGQR